MIPGDDDDVAAACAGCTAEKIIVEVLGMRAGNAGVENVARDEQGVNSLRFERVDQPVQEGGMFVVALAVEQRASEMPVGGVEEFHGSMRCRVRCME